MKTTLFIPALVMIEEAAAKLSYTQEILGKLKPYDIEYRIVPDDAGALAVLQETKKKQHLYLTINKGKFLRAKNFGHDCTSREDAYCLDHVSGCHYACVYCYLHTYLKHDPLVRVHVNIEDMFEELVQHGREQGSFFVSTGELSDSLMFDHITGLVVHMAAFLQKCPHIFVEFRSKSGACHFVKDVSPLPNMCFTWTLSPQEVVEKYELKTASLAQRIDALAHCQDAGLKTGVIIDPMIHYERWREGYGALIELMSQRLNLVAMERFYVGTFRYMKGMDLDILEKFPKTDLFCGEYVLARDGKYRYYKPIREEMYRFVQERLATFQRPMSLSMEFPETWKKIIGR